MLCIYYSKKYIWVLNALEGLGKTRAAGQDSSGNRKPTCDSVLYHARKMTGVLPVQMPLKEMIRSKHSTMFTICKILLPWIVPSG
jgi:hypothetical protein